MSFLPFNPIPSTDTGKESPEAFGTPPTIAPIETSEESPDVAGASPLMSDASCPLAVHTG